MCEEWMDSQVFIGWAVKNGWRPGLTIERIDVNKGYSPENCTIIPYALQAQNKTTNIRIKINGEEKCCLSGAEYLISRSKEHGKDTTCLGIEMSKPFSMKGI